MKEGYDFSNTYRSSLRMLYSVTPKRHHRALFNSKLRRALPVQTSTTWLGGVCFNSQYPGYRQPDRRIDGVCKAGVRRKYAADTDGMWRLKPQKIRLRKRAYKQFVAALGIGKDADLYSRIAQRTPGIEPVRVEGWDEMPDVGNEKNDGVWEVLSDPDKLIASFDPDLDIRELDDPNE